jgi:hypothetical protein
MLQTYNEMIAMERPLHMFASPSKQDDRAIFVQVGVQESNVRKIKPTDRWGGNATNLNIAYGAPCSLSPFEKRFALKGTSRKRRISTRKYYGCYGHKKAAR